MPDDLRVDQCTSAPGATQHLMHCHTKAPLASHQLRGCCFLQHQYSTVLVYVASGSHAGWFHAASLVEALKDATKEKVGVELILHAKPKGEDGQQQVDELIQVVKASSGPLGVIQKVRGDSLICMHEAVRTTMASLLHR